MTSGIHIGGYHKNGNKNQRDNFCQKTGHFCKPEESKETEKQVSTAQIFIEVKSVMKEGEEASDIRDIKPLELIPRDYTKLIIIGSSAGFLLILLIIGTIIFVKKRKKELCDNITNL